MMVGVQQQGVRREEQGAGLRGAVVLHRPGSRPPPTERATTRPAGTGTGTERRTVSRFAQQGAARMTTALDGRGRLQPAPSWSSAPLTVATLVLMLTAIWLRQGSGAAAFPGWPLLTFTVLAWLPLVVRTRWPSAGTRRDRGRARGSAVAAAADRPGAGHTGRMAAYQPVPVATMMPPSPQRCACRGGPRGWPVAPPR